MDFYHYRMDVYTHFQHTFMFFKQLVKLILHPMTPLKAYDVAKKNIIWCIWCNAMCLCGLSFKKYIIFHILYIIVAPLCSAFLKRIDFYKAPRSEKRGVLWLASYPVRCDWPLTVLWCRVTAWRDKNNKTHYKRGICCIQWGHNYWL